MPLLGVYVADWAAKIAATIITQQRQCQRTAKQGRLLVKRWFHGGGDVVGGVVARLACGGGAG